MSALGTHVSLTLARFNDLHQVAATLPQDGSLFQQLGADVRAAATTADTGLAFKFVFFGIHDSRESAQEAHRNNHETTVIREADEVWSGVLQPFRHYGEANFVNQSEPGPCYDVTQTPPGPGVPIVILTSVGWKPGADKDRIAEFSRGVAGVRISMTAVDGLHSQQTFSFPGGLEWDGLTVTFWRDQAAAMAWAYGGGLHKAQVKQQREAPFGDRTSFTRCVVLESSGTWHGTDPLARA